MGNHQILAPQRKDLDAAHAAAQGIRIPRVFTAFEEGRDFVLQQNGKLIIRTEHPLEREGLSGLNMSHTVSLEDVVLHEQEGGLFASFRDFNSVLLDYMMQDWHKKRGSARHYCELHGLSLDEYVAGLTHSYWEYVSGYNLYVVADPVISNRYRLFAGWNELKNNSREYPVTSYDVFDGEVKLTGGRTHAAVIEKIGDILRLYNKVREVFGQEMCWVVEMQLAGNGELYFLQRSVGQLFKPCEWSFGPPETCHFLVGHQYGFGEVRGTTPKEGVELSFLFERGVRAKWFKDYEHSAILDSHISSPVVEQKRVASMPYVQTYPQGHGDGARDPHSSILPLVRAPLYLYLPDLHDLLPPEFEWEHDRVKKAKRERVRDWYSDPKRMPQITLHVRSDGNEARVNILKIV